MTLLSQRDSTTDHSSSTKSLQPLSNFKEIGPIMTAQTARNMEIETLRSERRRQHLTNTATKTEESKRQAEDPDNKRSLKRTHIAFFRTD